MQLDGAIGAGFGTDARGKLDFNSRGVGAGGETPVVLERLYVGVEHPVYSGIEVVADYGRVGGYSGNGRVQGQIVRCALRGGIGAAARKGRAFEFHGEAFTGMAEFETGTSDRGGDASGFRCVQNAGLELAAIWFEEWMSQRG